jgi:hypothetical protein
MQARWLRSALAALGARGGEQPRSVQAGAEGSAGEERGLGVGSVPRGCGIGAASGRLADEDGGVEGDRECGGKVGEEEYRGEEESLPLAPRPTKAMKKGLHSRCRGKCRAKRAASHPPSGEPPRERTRRVVPFGLEAIRQANPDLEDEQGPRALLRPVAGLKTKDLLGPDGWYAEAAPLAHLDRVVDALCEAPADDHHERGMEEKAAGGAGAAGLWERRSVVVASPRDLQLYTLDTSAQMLAAALHAGFFVFASEFSMPGRPLEQRGMINLEVRECVRAFCEFFS